MIGVFFKYYPFYNGRGLRGFFFGGGGGVLVSNEKHQIYSYNASDTSLFEYEEEKSYFSSQFQFGQKIVAGNSFFLEPSIMLWMVSGSEDIIYGGWFGITTGFMW